MRARLLLPFFCLLLTFKLAAQSTGMPFNWTWANGPYGGHAFKIATLAASSAGTFDHLHLIAVTNVSDYSGGNSTIDATFGNRGGLLVSFTTSGAPVSNCSHLTAYGQSDGSVDIYFQFCSYYVAGSYTVLENLQETLYSNPTDIGDATPSGTLLWDSANSADTQQQVSFAGNTGIGTNTPNGELSIVANNTNSETGIHVANPDPTGFSVLRLGTVDTNEQSTGFAIHSFNSAWQADPASSLAPSSASLLAIDAGGMSLDTLSAAPIRFFTGGYSGANERMRIDPVGNVGIGTTTPTARLEVNGDIKLSAGTGSGITFADGSRQTSALSPSSLGTITSGTWNGSPITPPYLPSNVVYSDSNQSISGQKSFLSNVGIGTATPQVPLDVGSLSSAGYAHFSGTSNPITAVQGAYLSWNALTGGTGETDFINNPGLGSGGFAFMQTKTDGTNLQTLAYLDPSGNLGLGTTSPHTKLEVNGIISLTQGSGASITFPDGTVQSTAYTGTCVATGGDYAESMDVVGVKSSYEPGDVMVLAAETGSDITKSTEPYSAMVAGIYATKPGFVGRRQLSDVRLATKEIPMAMVGVVPTKVSAENGAIHRGDLLVTSSLPGVAMKGTDRNRMMGAVVGKAMGTLESGNGTIEVLVTLQ